MGCAHSSREAPPEAARCQLPHIRKAKPVQKGAADAKASDPLNATVFLHASAAADPLGGSHNEAQSIKALHALSSDAVCTERLDSIVHMARQAFQVNIAVLSLTGVDCRCFRAKKGIEIEEPDWHTTFGSWVLPCEQGLMVVVEDAQHERICEHALVTGPIHLRFFACAPLKGSDGTVYGTLHIADQTPRGFAADQRAILTNFAELVVRTLEAPRLQELHKQPTERAAAQGVARLPELRMKAVDSAAAASAAAAQLQAVTPRQQRQAVQELIEEIGVATITPAVQKLGTTRVAVLLCDLETERWEMRWVNPCFAELAGIPQQSAAGRELWSLFRVAGDAEEAMAECDASIFCKQSFFVTVMRVDMAPAEVAAGAPEQLELRFSPVSHGPPRLGLAAGDVPSFVPSAHLYWAQVMPAGTVSAAAVRCAMGTSAACPSSPGSPWSAAASIGGCPSPEVSRPSFCSSGSLGQMRSVSFAMPSGLADKAAVFDQVKLGELLGSGSYGRVYKGSWRGAEVAVKVMDYYSPLITNTFELDSDKHSALLEALLGRDFTRHPCLVQTFELGLRPVDPVDPDNPPIGPVRHSLWVVCEYCNRGSLHDAVLKGRFRLPSCDATSSPNMLSVLLTAQDIAGGMSLLHDAGIMHSDLSANNVLLKAAANSRRFTAAVSDFGLSRICNDTDGKHTQTVGTVTHQPPELLMEGMLTPAADTYAFGVLLWTLYSGQAPYAGCQPCNVIHQVVSGTRCPLELPPDAPSGFKDLFERCVAYGRTQRPTFHRILDILAPLVEAAEAEAPPMSPSSRASSRSPTNRSPNRSPFQRSPSMMMKEQVTVGES